MKKDSVIDAKTALSRLLSGNARYIAAKKSDGNISQQIRIFTHEHGQTPYAIVIACSDSRVIPEKIFMTGIGELFTIRVAGNVIGPFELGSIEYAAKHLGVKLVLVLGHSRCGAVGAAIKNAGHDSILSITDEIQKAIGKETEPELCEKQNVRHSISRIKESPLIQQMQKEDGLQIAGGYYHTLSGKVELLVPNPS